MSYALVGIGQNDEWEQYMAGCPGQYITVPNVGSPFCAASCSTGWIVHELPEGTYCIEPSYAQQPSLDNGCEGAWYLIDKNDLPSCAADCPPGWQRQIDEQLGVNWCLEPQAEPAPLPGPAVPPGVPAPTPAPAPTPLPAPRPGPPPVTEKREEPEVARAGMMAEFEKVPLWTYGVVGATLLAFAALASR